MSECVCTQLLIHSGRSIDNCWNVSSWASAFPWCTTSTYHLVHVFQPARIYNSALFWFVYSLTNISYHLLGLYQATALYICAQSSQRAGYIHCISALHWFYCIDAHLVQCYYTHRSSHSLWYSEKKNHQNGNNNHDN